MKEPYSTWSNSYVRSREKNTIEGLGSEASEAEVEEMSMSSTSKVAQQNVAEKKKKKTGGSPGARAGSGLRGDGVEKRDTVVTT